MDDAFRAQLDGNHWLAHDLRGADLPTLVAFGGLASEVGMPPFEFFHITGDLPVNRLFIRDLEQCFYQGGVPDLGRTIAEITDGLKPIVTNAPRSLMIGTSAGGFAALACGAHLDIPVVAVSPVTFLGFAQRALHTDGRWTQAVRRARVLGRRHRDQWDLRSYISGFREGARVYYPLRNRLDRLHSERLGRIPGVSLCPLNSNRHDVIREMRSDGSLERLLRAHFF